MIQCNITKISTIFKWVFPLEADQVLAIEVSFEENRGIVVEVQIKNRNILAISIVEKIRDGLVSYLRHHKAVKSE